MWTSARRRRSHQGQATLFAQPVLKEADLGKIRRMRRLPQQVSACAVWTRHQGLYGCTNNLTIVQSAPWQPFRAPCRSAAAADNRPDRRAAILLAAESCLPSTATTPVSIRQIALEAQVPLALVAYYYGQKHELFHAIFAHWRGTIDARMEAVAPGPGQPRTAALRRIVEAFVNPVLALRASSEGEYYAQLVARELAYRTPIPSACWSTTSTPGPCLHRRLARSAPHRACAGRLGLSVRHGCAFCTT